MTYDAGPKPIAIRVASGEVNIVVEFGLHESSCFKADEVTQFSSGDQTVESEILICGDSVGSAQHSLHDVMERLHCCVEQGRLFGSGWPVFVTVRLRVKSDSACNWRAP